METKRNRRSRKATKLKSYIAEAKRDAAAEFPTDVKRSDKELIRDVLDDVDDAFIDSGDLTKEQKQIVAQYSAMFKLALIRLNFNRVRRIVKDAEKLLKPSDAGDPMRAEITACRELNDPQVGILKTHGFHFFFQFEGWTESELKKLPNVGAKTVAAVAAYLKKAKHPLPKRPRNPYRKK